LDAGFVVVAIYADSGQMRQPEGHFVLYREQGCQMAYFQTTHLV
jgi:hypothetical protein